MAGVNNVSTYDNAPENSNNIPEHTNKAADNSDDRDEDSFYDFIKNELSKQLDVHESTPANRVKCRVDIMLTAESIHSASIKETDNVEYSDLRPLKPNEYQDQKDNSELFLITENQNCAESVTGLEPEIHFELDPRKSDIDNDGPLSDNMSSGFEDGVARELSDLHDPQCAELDEPRIFTRPLPVDESDNVTELVFDTWTTVDDAPPEVKIIETNGGYGENSTSDINPASPSKQECFDINTPAITNSVVSFRLN